MLEVTYKVEVKAMVSDCLGYTSIVFENLEWTDPDYHYIMAVMFPNWDQAKFNIGDVGYVTLRYVTGGVDKWFDGVEFNIYRYSNVIFLKFIPEKKEVDITNIQID